jgi:hypothetical protein
MSRPDPIEYAERLYGAIRAANFSPMSFLAFGNAVKEGVAMRSMPRIAVEPFMRIVGEMLDLEQETNEDQIEANVIDAVASAASETAPTETAGAEEGAVRSAPGTVPQPLESGAISTERKRNRGKG